MHIFAKIASFIRNKEHVENYSIRKTYSDFMKCHFLLP